MTQTNTEQHWREIESAESALEELRVAVKKSARIIQSELDARCESGLGHPMQANSIGTIDLDQIFCTLKLAIRASCTDPLTGLRNRIGLMDRLQHEIEIAKRNGYYVGVYFIDVDNFKGINDEYGHIIGDATLIAIAELLTSTVRESDTVCRYGGDEFIVVCQSNKLFSLHATSHKLKKTIMIPVEDQKKYINVFTSLGLAIYPEDGDSPESLIKQADKNMYLNKRRKSFEIHADINISNF